MDCEYLKKCCEKLTEENRRLQKELQELRALKSAHPYYMHVPATTLTMCPSCEKIASATTTPTLTNNKPDNGLEINHDGQKTDSPWSSFLNPFWHQQKTPTATTTTTTRHHNSAALWGKKGCLVHRIHIINHMCGLVGWFCLSHFICLPDWLSSIWSREVDYIGYFCKYDQVQGYCDIFFTSLLYFLLSATARASSRKSMRNGNVHINLD